MMIFLISFYNFTEALDIFNDVFWMLHLRWGIGHVQWWLIFFHTKHEPRHWTCAMMVNISHTKLELREKISQLEYVSYATNVFSSYLTKYSGWYNISSTDVLDILSAHWWTVEILASTAVVSIWPNILIYTFSIWPHYICIGCSITCNCSKLMMYMSFVVNVGAP